MDLNVDDFKPKSNSHILHKMWNKDYGLGFRNAIKCYLKFIITNKELKNVKNKLFLNQLVLTIQQINQFIQSAIEITVVRYFAENFPLQFKLEPKLNEGSDNDVECQFQIENLKFNIEVKATSYIDNNPKDKDAFVLQTKGRLNDYKELLETMQNFLPNLKLDKRYDNNLKSHLYSAQSKFPKNDSYKFCNVLIIGCNDSNDIQNHYDYLYSEQGGFFTKQSFVEHSKFDLVDIVFLTNLFYKHNFKMENPKLDQDSWKFEKSFIIGFKNPYRKYKKEEHLKLIEAIIPNYTKSFKEYKGGPDFYRLRHFIHTELGTNRKIYFY